MLSSGLPTMAAYLLIQPTIVALLKVPWAKIRRTTPRIHQLVCNHLAQLIISRM